ncbi:MAG: ASKHA domain-containing protein [Anaerolineales bacterium]
MPSDPSHRPKSVQVNFEPIGRRVQVEQGADLLSAAQTAGVRIISICGGVGSCDSCRVQKVRGQLSDHSLIEKDVFDRDELGSGFRLACQTDVIEDATVYVPPESLSSVQRLQVEGEEVKIDADPAVVSIELTVDPPSLTDLRSDISRIEQALISDGLSQPHFDFRTLRELPLLVRKQDWNGSIICRDSEIVTFLPPQTRLVGLALDIGTTKLAAYLVDLESGKTLAMLGAMNPQINFGEDVISRIAYVAANDGGEASLQRELSEAINIMVAEMCAEADVERSQIVDAVVVGNTAMHHLFAGLPVEQLGLAPYVPAVTRPIYVHASELGLDLAPLAKVFFPPIIAGYVGADHLAMLLAAGAGRSDTTILAVDIGTNTEISLVQQDGILSCSCASGPAFEGAHIQDGMRASAGAIERVQIIDDEVRTYTIEDQPAVGICGSGILDAVAVMFETGAIESSGRLHAENSFVYGSGRDAHILIVPGAESGHGRDIRVTGSDVHEIQLAKGAIRAGTDILLEEAGVRFNDLDEIIVAGAFGTYLNLESAVGIGMFPDLPRDQFRQVGNAAGAGARLLLVSKEKRKETERILQNTRYIELTTSDSFQEKFVNSMTFAA